jgi:serine/threonine protein kinase
VKAEPARRLRSLREKSEKHATSSGDPTRDTCGLTMEDYELLEQVGEGGMAKVYRALDKKTGRHVAIKVMLPDVASTPEGVRSFMREMDITRQLRHPNIVDLLGFVKAKGTYFLVMEFVEGHDLAAYLRPRGGKLGLAELAPIMLGVLDGLGHAHRAHITVRLAEAKATEVIGIVHRDLKPSNIFLAEAATGITPKIADFGLAKAFRAAGLTDMTRPGEVSGTPGYWPREQLVHYRFLAPASDVFSAAAVFYEVLTGQRIRQGFTEMQESCKKVGQQPGLAQYIQVICSNPTVPIAQRDPKIPPAVAAVMDRALRESTVNGTPEQVRAALGELRYMDASAFADALRGALRESGIAV